MAEVNYYLKDKNAKEETLIYMFFSFDSKRLKYSTGEKVLPKNWIADTQKARKSVKRKFDPTLDLNDYLDTLKEIVKDIYRTEKVSGKRLTIEHLRELLDIRLDKVKEPAELAPQMVETELTPLKVKADLTFFEVFDSYISTKKNVLAVTTIAKYNTLKTLLQGFRPNIKFQEIDYGFYEDLINYEISDYEHMNPTIEKNIESLKSFLNWSIKRGYNMNLKSSTFSLTEMGIEHEPSPTPLTKEEFKKLQEYDFTENRRLEKIRDIYCFACFTGLRISDWKRVRKTFIKNGFIDIHSVKGRIDLKVPLHKKAKDILEKYNYVLPMISEANFNKYIKDACRIAKITDEWTITQYRGKERIETKKPKCDFVTAHTGRDTFITMHLSAGTPPHVLISYTGHKDIEMLKPYYRFADSVKANYMDKAFK